MNIAPISGNAQSPMRIEPAKPAQTVVAQANEDKLAVKPGIDNNNVDDKEDLNKVKSVQEVDTKV